VADLASHQAHHHWLRERHRREHCAVITDPLAFGVAASMRRVAERYGLPMERLLEACRVSRAELDRTGEVIDAYRAGMRILVPQGHRP
jgi:hypothetical protein